jgi:hypothetical protein
MERKLFFAAVVIPWLVIPLTALSYSRAWDRLPSRVAVHFDANWQPNGWTSREGARTLALGMELFLVGIFTIASFAVSRARSSNASQWMFVAAFYVAIGVTYFVNQWIVDRSLAQQSVPVVGAFLRNDPQLNNGLLR